MLGFPKITPSAALEESTFQIECQPTTILALWIPEMMRNIRTFKYKVRKKDLANAIAALDLLGQNPFNVAKVKDSIIHLEIAVNESIWQQKDSDLLKLYGDLE